MQDIDFASKDKVMRLLDQAAASLNGSTGEDLGPAFKRYRQAVFKLNYKINKLKDGKKGGANVSITAPFSPSLKSASSDHEAQTDTRGSFRLVDSRIPNRMQRFAT